MPSDLASLTILSDGGVPIFYIREFLAAVDVAYNYVLLAESFIVYPAEARSRLISNALEGGHRFGRMVPLADRVILKSVELRSPGWWEFLGKMSPLEQIRLYLTDRHERRKDRDYREAAEASRLSLENEVRATDVLRAQIATAREMGATDDDLRPLLHHFIRLPLGGLDRFQDEGLIKEVKLGPPDPSPKPPQPEQSSPLLLPPGKRKFR